MKKAFDPKSIEQRWYEYWESSGFFKPSDESATGSFSIMIPPPNVTGTLHMGHAFQDTLMDILTRYHRMLGEKTLWQPGTDHAGIATQMVVERNLSASGETRHSLGRERFIDAIWDWKEQSGGTISQQLRRMGASVDWSRERFTMDEGLSAAVRRVFVELYREDLIYRGKRLVNWDPVLHTAVSDLEVISEEEQGSLWHIRYPLADDPEKHLVVATTRPETMFGDTAVAVHPEDERYIHLIGKQVNLPLTDRQIPIIADDYVDREFGTGCVKITPAHDFNDYEMGQRHDLPMINVLTQDACMNENVPESFRGLDRFDARKQVVEQLQSGGLMDHIEPHTLMVPRGDRSRAIIEPFLTDQWFVRAAPLAEPAIKAVQQGDIRFVPENWSKTYFEWMNNIQDWCISRQIWWGHRIPAWYDESGQVYVAETVTEAEQMAAEKQGQSVSLHQDEDVLDTWFSSALWPFSTLGWPEQTQALKDFYPTSVLVTGFDIIFFWVARMIMMGLKFTGEVPFREVYIHGLVRDAHGQKMSKSKGNVLDPIDLIDGISLDELLHKRTHQLMQPEMAEKIAEATKKEFPEGIPAFGTDALRFTFAVMASTGRDINFDLGRIGGYRNFCNKLWNASRFVLMQMEDYDQTFTPSVELREYPFPDRWICSRLQQTIREIRRGIENYRMDLAAQSLYDFVWSEFCDWYLELVKPVLNGKAGRKSDRPLTQKILIEVLEAILRLSHPFMPFITEEIYQRISPFVYSEAKSSIMLESYPECDPALQDQKAEEEIAWLQMFVLAVRKIRSGMDIPPGKPLTIILHGGGTEDRRRVEEFQDYLKNLARIENLSWHEGSEESLPESATGLVADLKILIPIAGLIDKGAEIERLKKEIEKLDKQLLRVEGKLANEQFIGKAPEAVVLKEKEKAEEMKSARTQLMQQLEKIRGI